MIKQDMTIREAVQEWVNGFNAIPQSLLKRAFEDNIDDLVELTPPVEGDYVWSNEYQGVYEVAWVDMTNEKIALFSEDGEWLITDLDDVYVQYDSWLPAWGYLWMFDNLLDKEWAKENLELVAKCGFRIFEDQETGDIYIGIDGAGYDFYESHWIPLYKARGLMWHEIN